MGRWASLLGVLISIGTAYALFYFSNILEFLQVLVFFFIVPLFGVVILGMLWKRATPGRRLLGLPHRDPLLHLHVGLRPHVPRRLPSRSPT